MQENIFVEIFKLVTNGKHPFILCQVHQLSNFILHWPLVKKWCTMLMKRKILLTELLK